MKKVTASSNTSCCASTKKWATSPQRNSRHRQSNSMLIWRRQLHLSVDFNKVANPWKTFCPRWLQTTTAWSLSAPTGLTQIAGIWHTICYSVETKIISLFMSYSCVWGRGHWPGFGCFGIWGSEHLRNSIRLFMPIMTCTSTVSQDWSFLSYGRVKLEKTIMETFWKSLGRSLYHLTIPSRNHIGHPRPGLLGPRLLCQSGCTSVQRQGGVQGDPGSDWSCQHFVCGTGDPGQYLFNSW